MSRLYLFSNTDYYNEAVCAVRSTSKCYEFDCACSSVNDVIQVYEPIGYLALNNMQTWCIKDITHLFKLKCVSNSVFIVKINDVDKLLDLLDVADKHNIKACIKKSNEGLLELKRNILIANDNYNNEEYEF